MEKILVVNNDIDTMTLIKDLLEKKSYKVKYTSNGEESLHIAKKFVPDLVLVDVLQKDVIPNLKRQPETSQIPIVLMTGYTWSNDTINNVEADDLIEKPFLMEHLQQKIQQNIKKDI